jgi:catechol 2,3-dioxygenase-like lactoylglutathione lyase family enzyme
MRRLTWWLISSALSPRRATGRERNAAIPRVAGIDHLVLSVGDFARSKDFYDRLLKFLGFKRKHDYEDMTGWSNGKTLFWIAAADAEGRKRKYRKGDIGFHHYAFELSSRKDVDALGAFLEKNGLTVVDPPGEYYGRNYYAVYFTDPDGMKLEGMIWAPPQSRKAAARSRPPPTKIKKKHES